MDLYKQGGVYYTLSICTDEAKTMVKCDMCRIYVVHYAMPYTVHSMFNLICVEQ